MTQYARPDGVVAAGSWTDSDGLAGPSHLNMDETTANTSDYNRAEDSGSGGTIGPFKVSLSNVTDPVSATAHVVKVNVAGEDVAMDGTVPSLTYALYDTTVSTSTPIATKTFTPADGSWGENTISLNATQANSILDYTALQLWFTLNELEETSGGSLVKVTWAVFECGDAPVASSGNALSGLSGLSGISV